MLALVVVLVATALAAAAVALTRLRFGRAGATGHARIGGVPLAVHGIAGAVGLVVWVAFIVIGDRIGQTPSAVVGIVGLGCWWVVAAIGLLILGRWAPTKGRHASAAGADTWSKGPWLSVLAHVGTLACVAVMTWGYLVQVV